MTYLNITPIFKKSTQQYTSPLNMCRYILSFILNFSVYFRLNMTFSEDFNWNIYIINSLSEADSGRALSSVEKTEFHLMNSNQEYVFIG